VLQRVRLHSELQKAKWWIRSPRMCTPNCLHTVLYRILYITQYWNLRLQTKWLLGRPTSIPLQWVDVYVRPLQTTARGPDSSRRTLLSGLQTHKSTPCQSRVLKSTSSVGWSNTSQMPTTIYVIVDWLKSLIQCKFVWSNNKRKKIRYTK
jgi:hypothetical protein